MLTLPSLLHQPAAHMPTSHTDAATTGDFKAAVMRQVAYGGCESVGLPTSMYAGSTFSR